MAAVAFGCVAVAAQAQEYPSRGLEAIHQFGPGGGTDNFVRAIAGPFEEITGHPLTPISVQGGGGVPASVTFMQRPADGHSLMAIGPEQVINHALGRISMDDLRPVARVQYDQGLFLVKADSPIQSVDDLIAAAQAEPGGINVAVTGTVGFDDALVGLWNLATETELTTVPFSAAEMVSNTLGGHVDLMYEEYGPARGLLESGDLRALVVFSEERLPELPDVPTARELGYEVTLGRWRGFALQAGDSPETAQALFDIVAEAAASDAYKQIEADNALQYRSVLLGPDEFAAFLEEEIAIYTEVLNQLGLIGN
jgi:putative tricarboxylic transport membrane protein